MTSPTNSDVTSFFVVTDLTPITDTPTRVSLRSLQTDLNTNAMSVPTNESILGHLALTMNSTAYLQKATTAFPVPTNPGSGPTMARTATDAVIKQAHFEYKTKKAEYDIYNATDRALKTQLIKAVPDMFFNILKDDDIGYASVTTLEILTHLWDTYGSIDDDQLAANIARMNTPWSPPTPIDKLFTQLKIGKKFATEGAEPITDSSAVRTGVGIIEQNGLFPISCREWRGKTATNKTWTHFVEHFRLAEKEFNRSATTENAGYHTANAAVNQPYLENSPDSDNIPFVTTPHAFAAAVAEAAAFPAPTPPPTPPSPAFDPAAFAAAVVAAVAAANPDNGRGRRGRRDRRPTIPAGYGYCWTHGHVPQTAGPHCSATCRTRKSGHREDATADNRMGGSNTVYQRR